MRKCRRETAVRLIIWCAPALVLLLIGVFGFGIIPNLVSVPCLDMIAGAGLAVTRIIFLFRSPAKAGKKAVLTAVWIGIFAAACFICLLMPRTVHHGFRTDARSRFEADVSRLFPESVSAAMETGTAESAEYHTFTWSVIIFDSRSWTLLCRYGEEEYEKAAAAVEERFRFRTEPLETGYYDDRQAERTADPYALIGDERFRMAEPGDGDTYDFYKRCFLVMTDDVKRQIAYIAFSDDDLDMAESLEKLINEECGWKYLGL